MDPGVAKVTLEEEEVVERGGISDDRPLEPDVVRITVRKEMQSEEKCIVIGELWPAWYPAVVGLMDAHRVQVFCGEGVATELIETSVVNRDQWLAHTALQQGWQAASLICMSGSAAFIRQFDAAGWDTRRVIAVIDIVSGSPRPRHRARSTLQWEQTTHGSTGGATNAVAWIGFGDSMLPTSRPIIPPMSRRILEYIDPVQSGPRVGASHDLVQECRTKEFATVQHTPQGLVHPAGKLDVADIERDVLCPSVFCKEDWIRRPLNTRELSQLWDLPARWKKSFDDCPRSVLAFTRTAPAKILWHTLMRLPLFNGRVKPQTLTLSDCATGSGYGVMAADTTTLSSDLAKAAKHDDAEVTVSWWNERVFLPFGTTTQQALSPRQTAAADCLRGCLLKRWRRNVRVGLFRHMDSKHGTGKRHSWYKEVTRSPDLLLDMEVGRDVIRRVCDADWWYWKGGSTLFFWRWPSEFQNAARDGATIRVRSPLPSNRTKQRKEKDEEACKKVEKKLRKVVDVRYMDAGKVTSLTDYHWVPKAKTDIRMVYNGTSSGLNEAVWVPNYALPTIDSVLDCVSHDSFMGDLDLGDCFLNFPMDRKLRPYAGVDVSPYLKECSTWMRWNRNFMGFKPSPYNTARMLTYANDVIRGDRHDPTNPFRWHSIALNLPGSPHYDPRKAWVMKLAHTPEGETVVAADFRDYVDDFRSIAASFGWCWFATCWIAKLLQYLGIQDAPRKRRPPMKQPGAWAGSVIKISEKGIGVSVTEERWLKMRLIIEKWKTKLDTGELDLSRKELESDRGFLIYVGRTFVSIKPFLKGIHLTIDGWRPGRNDDGWKERTPQWNAELGCMLPGADESPEAPALVRAVPRLHADLKVLSKMTEGFLPPTRIIRPKKSVSVRFGFGDAAGEGFGSTVEGSDGINVRFGTWGMDNEGMSSNFRELRNIVESLEDLWEAGELAGTELFFFTDNSVAEAAFYKGTSNSPLLHELVVRLRMLELKAGLVIHLIHCAGTRQIAQGSDGLSRGDLTEGVMSGRQIADFVPIHLTGVERSPTIEGWIKSWLSGDEKSENTVSLLSPEGWFEEGQDLIGGKKNQDGVWMPTYSKGCYIWDVAPTSARVALEQLRKARLRRQESIHVFVCPRLMQYSWKRQFLKEMDFVFELPAGSVREWESLQHEPLTFGICLPYIRCNPWKLARTPQLLAMERRVRELLKTSGGDPRPILRELLSLPRKLGSLSPSVVRKVLYFEK